jgi:hypothetical protein
MPSEHQGVVKMCQHLIRWPCYHKEVCKTQLCLLLVNKTLTGKCFAASRRLLLSICALTLRPGPWLMV